MTIKEVMKNLKAALEDCISKGQLVKAKNVAKNSLENPEIFAKDRLEKMKGYICPALISAGACWDDGSCAQCPIQEVFERKIKIAQKWYDSVHTIDGCSCRGGVIRPGKNKAPCAAERLSNNTAQLTIPKKREWDFPAED